MFEVKLASKKREIRKMHFPPGTDYFYFDILFRFYVHVVTKKKHIYLIQMRMLTFISIAMHSLKGN